MKWLDKLVDRRLDHRLEDSTFVATLIETRLRTTLRRLCLDILIEMIEPKLAAQHAERLAMGKAHQEAMRTEFAEDAKRRTEQDARNEAFVRENHARNDAFIREHYALLESFAKGIHDSLVRLNK